MACCNPFFYKPRKSDVSRYAYNQTPMLGYQIPCGYCLNCRVDKRNLWSDRCKYELCNRLSASFVTVTYDDINLNYLMVPDHNNERFSMLPSLNYKHAQRFINRLRMKIKRSPELHNVLCQPDFSYVYVGEYGEHGQKFNRPHFHFLFFGLDFAYCKKLFESEWKYGIIDVLPLLDGGINYVLKYMDKQLFGNLAFEKYDAHGLERPKRSQSKSFGANLFYSNIDYAKKNNWTYKSGRVNRPYPKYYRDKILGTDIKTQSRTYDKLQSTRITKDVMKRDYNLKDLSYKASLSFKLRQAQLRERKLRQALLNDGIGVLDYVQTDSFAYYSPDRNKINKLDDSIKNWLSIDYVNQLRADIKSSPDAAQRYVDYCLSKNISIKYFT